MNKQQILAESQDIGLKVSRLIHEFRNSSGQDIECDEAEYSEFFAGLVLFLCTGKGTAQIECDPTPEYNLIDGTVTNHGEAHYPLDDEDIFLDKSVTERRFYKDGEIRTSYTVTMDPTTYVNYFSKTGFFGPPIRQGVRKNEEV